MYKMEFFDNPFRKEIAGQRSNRVPSRPTKIELNERKNLNYST